MDILAGGERKKKRERAVVKRYSHAISFREPVILDSIVTYLALHDQPKYQKWKLVMGTQDVLRCYDACMYTKRSPWYRLFITSIDLAKYKFIVVQGEKRCIIYMRRASLVGCKCDFAGNAFWWHKEIYLIQGQAFLFPGKVLVHAFINKCVLINGPFFPTLLLWMR